MWKEKSATLGLPLWLVFVRRRSDLLSLISGDRQQQILESVVPNHHLRRGDSEENGGENGTDENDKCTQMRQNKTPTDKNRRLASLCLLPPDHIFLDVASQGLVAFARLLKQANRIEIRDRKVAGVLLDAQPVIVRVDRPQHEHPIRQEAKGERKTVSRTP